MEVSLKIYLLFLHVGKFSLVNTSLKCLRHAISFGLYTAQLKDFQRNTTSICKPFEQSSQISHGSFFEAVKIDETVLKQMYETETNMGLETETQISVWDVPKGKM